jgi:hypothetical protein
MPKRKIEAEVAVNVTGIEKVDRLEESIEKLSDTEIEVGADTTPAQSALQRFESELDALNLDSARELRIEFRAQVLQQQVRTALRDLDRLEDPIQIRTQTAELERAQTELRELAELASRKYQVDVEIDPRRNAARAADDIDRIRQRGEGLQSALPALRGFTDEMGQTAVASGIAGQALGDLGDFSLILGEKFGLSEKATAGLGTALGAAGLATVIVGFALPAIKSLIDSQEDLDEETRKAVDAIGQQTGAIEALKAAIDSVTETDPLLTAILGPFGDDQEKLDKIGDSVVAIGKTVEDLPGIFRQLSSETGAIDFLEDLRESSELSEKALGDLIDLMRGSSNLGEFDLDLSGAAPALQDFVALNRDAVEGLFELIQASTAVDLGAAYREALVDIQQTEEGLKLLGQAQANIGPDAGIEELLAEYQRLRAELDETEESVGRVSTVVRDGVGDWNGWMEAAREAFGAVLDGSVEAVAALDPVTKKLQEITGSIDEEQVILGLAEQFDRVAAAAAAAAEAQAKGMDDAESKARSYRREQLKLREEIVDYLETIEDIPLSKVTEIDTLLDRGNLVEAQRLLEELAGDRFANLFIDIVPRNTNTFNSLTFGISGDSAPIQGRTDYGAGTFLSAPITIINPPGTPAATSSSIDLHTIRNGDRSGAV